MAVLSPSASWSAVYGESSGGTCINAAQDLLMFRDTLYEKSHRYLKQEVMNTVSSTQNISFWGEGQQSVQVYNVFWAEN